VVEVLTALKISVFCFWVLTPCGFSGRHQRFGEIAPCILVEIDAFHISLLPPSSGRWMKCAPLKRRSVFTRPHVSMSQKSYLHTVSIFRAEARDSMYLRNFGTYLRIHTKSQPIMTSSQWIEINNRTTPSKVPWLLPHPSFLIIFLKPFICIVSVNHFFIVPFISYTPFSPFQFSAHCHPFIGSYIFTHNMYCSPVIKLSR
jgi:hypothetical protein